MPPLLTVLEIGGGESAGNDVGRVVGGRYVAELGVELVPDASDFLEPVVDPDLLEFLGISNLVKHDGSVGPEVGCRDLDVELLMI